MGLRPSPRAEVPFLFLVVPGRPGHHEPPLLVPIRGPGHGQADEYFAIMARAIFSTASRLTSSHFERREAPSLVPIRGPGHHLDSNYLLSSPLNCQGVGNLFRRFGSGGTFVRTEFLRRKSVLTLVPTSGASAQAAGFSGTCGPVGRFAAFASMTCAYSRLTACPFTQFRASSLPSFWSWRSSTWQQSGKVANVKLGMVAVYRRVAEADQASNAFLS